MQEALWNILQNQLTARRTYHPDSTSAFTLTPYELLLVFVLFFH